MFPIPVANVLCSTLGGRMGCSYCQQVLGLGKKFCGTLFPWSNPAGCHSLDFVR